MSLADDLRKKRQADGLEVSKFYICPSCENDYEGYDPLPKCPGCGREIEFTEASTKENVEKIKEKWAQPGFNRVYGNFKKATTDEEQHTESMTDKLQPYILDESKVMPWVPFAMFERNNELYAGIFMPRMKDLLDKDGQPTGKRIQIEAPVIVSSGGQLYEINQSFMESEELKVRFDSLPAHMTRRWSLDSIKAHLYRNADIVNPAGLYKNIRGAYQEYLYFSSPEWYSIHALWDMGTYLHQTFHAFPYLELRGIKGSAKTKIMQLSGCLSFNATSVMVAPTPATLFRETNDKRPSTYLDEAENLFKVIKGKVEHDERVEVINSGYTSEGSVPRMEARGKAWVQVLYRTYSPKMIGSINGLYGATESRSIIHITRRAPDNDKRGEKEIERHDKRWTELRDELYLFMFQHYHAVKQEYNRLLHENPTSLKKREFQLWRPILAVAKVIGQEVYDEVMAFAEKQASLKLFEEITEGSYEFAYLSRMRDLLKGGHTTVLFREMADAVPGDRKPHSKTVRRTLDSLGFRDYYTHTENGAGYRLSFDEFANIITPIAPEVLFASVPSGVNNSLDDREGKKSISELTETHHRLMEADGKPDFLTEVPEEIMVSADANDANDANLGRTTLGKADVLDAIRRLSPVKYELLQELFPVPELNDWLDALKERAEIMESPAGTFRGLE